ncbi:sarcosine oxidase subunit gamma [Roseibium sp.]|uniref:sarcosine oxidase subunit gamma n=1 Tax=Roseibium sp. TaxID=1936156 RepID=UPI003A986D87
MADDLVTTLYVPDAGEEPLLALADVSILRAAPLTRLSFRGRETAQAVLGKAFDMDLPQRPLTCALGGDRAALWLGPDEWLLLAGDEENGDLQPTLEREMDGIPCALVDISHRQDALLVTGQHAARLLNSGIPIDLHPESFAVGTVTRTLFHKAPVMLWRIGSDAFVVEAWGSFMDYASGLLTEAAQELTVA